MPKAYVIADVEVHDPDTYAGYRTLSTPAVEQYGGRFVVRGGATEVLEGVVTPHRTIVIEFDDLAAARRWWDSPEYTAAREVRQRAASSWFIVAEAVDGPPA